LRPLSDRRKGGGKDLRPGISFPILVKLKTQKFSGKEKASTDLPRITHRVIATYSRGERKGKKIT